MHTGAVYAWSHSCVSSFKNKVQKNIENNYTRGKSKWEKTEIIDKG